MIRPFYPFMRAKIKLFFSSDLIHEIKKSMKKKIDVPTSILENI
jgi:hypothetical protein